MPATRQREARSLLERRRITPFSLSGKSLLLTGSVITTFGPPTSSALLTSSPSDGTLRSSWALSESRTKRSRSSSADRS
ncbi:MAG: hypothetical protein RQ949_05495 [Candidatus Calditenuis sp.]|nr:hypothetical protein [Candidatus Calditenuis sp.]